MGAFMSKRKKRNRSGLGSEMLVHRRESGRYLRDAQSSLKKLANGSDDCISLYTHLTSGLVTSNAAVQEATHLKDSDPEYLDETLNVASKIRGFEIKFLRRCVRVGKGS